MLPPPAIRGVFRTDRRARAAYAEGAGIFRMLPAAVCVPADRQDVASVSTGQRLTVSAWCLAAPAALWEAGMSATA